MKEGYEKYCRFYGCEEKECWYNGCKCEGERLIIKEPKQETFEEAAEKYPYCYASYGSQRKSFIDGAKWQQERSYSEEDLKEAFGMNNKDWICFEEWFEQFKKK